MFDSVISLKSPDKAFLLSVAKRLKEAGNHGVGFYSPLSAVAKRIGAHTLVNSLPSLLDDIFCNMDDKKASAAGALIVTLCKLSRDELASQGCTPQVLFSPLLLLLLLLSLDFLDGGGTDYIDGDVANRKRGGGCAYIWWCNTCVCVFVYFNIIINNNKNMTQESREQWTAAWMQHVVRYMHHHRETIRRRLFFSLDIHTFFLSTSFFFLKHGVLLPRGYTIFDIIITIIVWFQNNERLA